jgi:hypothetical protein
MINGLYVFNSVNRIVKNLDDKIKMISLRFHFSISENQPNPTKHWNFIYSALNILNSI